MFGLSATLLVKGCDQWNETNTALTNLTGEVKWHTERIGEREERLKQLEKNLQLLYERTVARFDERREAADKLVNQIDERLDRLERYEGVGPNTRRP